MKWTLRAEGIEETIEAASVDEARDKAEAWNRSGDWDSSGGTIWVDCYLHGDDIEEKITTRLDPPEPRCVDRDTEHDWQSPYRIVGGLEENPGVHGHGGGVILREVCMHCGTERMTDTWAQRPDTGEQGLESVSYQKNKYAAELVDDEG